MPLSDEEFQRYKEAYGGQQPEQEEPERFESGRESADDGIEGLRQIAGSAPVQAATRTLQNVAMPIYNTLYDAVAGATGGGVDMEVDTCLLYTSPSPRDS